MKRMLTLVLFELRKVLSQKKALLFLLVLNVIPLVASMVAIIVYLKFKGWGMGELQFSALYKGVQALFTGHIKIFALIAPFFLALVVGDSISTEVNKGHMKMLLITPVRRWQVLTSKTIAVMIFLLIAITLGGIFLQTDILIARALTNTSSILGGLTQEMPLNIISTSAAIQILALTFVGNLMLIGFFTLFSLFFESAIIMSFTSLSILMGLQTYYFISTTLFLNKLDNWYYKVAQWCFTHHLSDLFAITRIKNILEGKETLMTPEVYQSVFATLGWAAFFYILAIAVFSRKQILH